MSTIVLLPLFRRVALCCALLSFSTPLLLAQVEVVGSGKARVALAVSGPNAQEAESVIRGDLQRTMMIELVEPTSAQVLATVVTTADTVQGTITDPDGGSLGQHAGAFDRSTLHTLSDMITLAATGSEGIARTRIAFISASSGQKEVYVMDIDGHDLRQRTDDRSISNSPSWHPNGERLVYTSYKSGYPDVYVIDLAEKTRTKFAAFPGYNSGARFSPNGESLALTLSKDGNPEIYMLSTKGGEPRRLTRTSGVDTSPSWSPDSQRIVFASDDRGAPQLFFSNTVGEAPELIQTNRSWNTEPDWSPDGERITFTTRRAGQQQIAVYEVATGNSEIVTKNGGEDSVWLRNSRHLIFVRSGKLYLLDSITKQETQLKTSVDRISEPAANRY